MLVASYNELSGADQFIFSTLRADSTLAGFIGATNEVQQVSRGTNSGGSFTLTVAGQTTGPIAFNASAATVQSALELLSTVGAGNVSVSGAIGGPWTVTFQGALVRRNIGQIILTSSLSGGSGQGVSTLTEGDSKIYLELAPQGAAFPYVILQFMSSPDRNVIGSDIRAFTRPLYIVKAVTQEAGFSLAGKIADRIDLLLMGASGQLTNPPLVIQGCFREQPIRYTEPVAGGERVNHLGGQYRLFINKTP